MNTDTALLQWHIFSTMFHHAHAGHALAGFTLRVTCGTQILYSPVTGTANISLKICILVTELRACANWRCSSGGPSIFVITASHVMSDVSSFVLAYAHNFNRFLCFHRLIWTTWQM